MATASQITSAQYSTYLGGTTRFTITRYDSNVLHTIKYRCGDVTETICSLSSSTSVSVVLPVSLASQNTSGLSVTVYFDIECYENGNMFSSTSMRRVYQIPEDVKPTCAVSVTDANGLLAKYGAYVQSKSKLRIVTTPTLAYGSPISVYKIIADGYSYSSADVETNVLTGIGEIEISATVTDARGRSGSASASVSATAYAPPAVVSFTADRVNADGSDNEQGDHVKVTFSCAVTPLNNKNSAVYKLEYKKSADAFYTEISVSDLNGNYAPVDVSRIFAADTGSGYDVRLTITDDFQTTIYDGKAQSGFATFHVPASGYGFSFGKVSEIDGLFDVAFRARFLGGFMQPELAAGTDFDDVTVTNIYACLDAATAGYINCPIESGTFTLQVTETDNGGIIQCVTSCSSKGSSVFSRCRVGNVWCEWSGASAGIQIVDLFDGSITNDGSASLTDSILNYDFILAFGGISGNKQFQVSGMGMPILMTGGRQLYFSVPAEYNSDGTVRNYCACILEFGSGSSVKCISYAKGWGACTIFKILGVKAGYGG